MNPSDRQRLVSAIDKNNKSTAMLKYAVDSLHNTEDVSVEIVTNLEVQREQLHNIKCNVQNINTATVTSRNILSRMSHNTKRRAALSVFLILLLVSLILAIYLLSR